MVQKATNNNANGYMRVYAHCCKFVEQTLPSGETFSASLDCNSYENESSSDHGAVAISQCQSDDEYMFGCNGYSDQANLRGFCPGNQECSGIKYSPLDGGKYENVDENHVDGGGRFMGYTNFDNQGTNGQCIAIKSDYYDTASGVNSQANCCKIEGYDTTKFELKEVQCQISFEAFGNFGDFDISCFDDEYQTVGITGYAVFDDMMIGSARTGFTGSTNKDSDIFADAVVFRQANGIEAYGICCKVIFEEI